MHLLAHISYDTGEVKSLSPEAGSIDACDTVYDPEYRAKAYAEGPVPTFKRLFSDVMDAVSTLNLSVHKIEVAVDSWSVLEDNIFQIKKCKDSNEVNLYITGREVLNNWYLID